MKKEEIALDFHYVKPSDIVQYLRYLHLMKIELKLVQRQWSYSL